MAVARTARGETGDDEEAVCRICFDGASEAEPLTQPCHCRGTQAFVHESCLLRWRRLQLLQGKVAASSKCEVCGSDYSSSLKIPRRPLLAVLRELARVISETTFLLAWHLGCLRFAVIFVCARLLCFWTTSARLSALLATSVPVVVAWLYSMGLRISVLGSGQDRHLGLTSFGLPVEGLSSGMLLVSVAAGGPFRRSVLYVLHHSDSGSLALILNAAASPDTVVPLCTAELAEQDAAGLDGRGDPVLRVSRRKGGPVAPGGVYTLHDVEGMNGSERLVRGSRVHVQRFGGELAAVQHLARTARRTECRARLLVPRRLGGGSHCAAIFSGVSSWGEHQLEGEIRRCAWGWLRPQHVRAEDVLQMDRSALDSMWDRLIRSPHLEVFQG